MSCCGEIHTAEGAKYTRPPREGKVEWRPAYQVYLGADWIGDASVEQVTAAAREHSDDLPDIPLLAGPELFDGLLGRFRHLEDVAEDSDADEGESEVSPDEDEVSLDEDEEASVSPSEYWLVASGVV